MFDVRLDVKQLVCRSSRMKISVQRRACSIQHPERCWWRMGRSNSPLAWRSLIRSHRKLPFTQGSFSTLRVCEIWKTCCWMWGWNRSAESRHERLEHASVEMNAKVVTRVDRYIHFTSSSNSDRMTTVQIHTKPDDTLSLLSSAFNQISSSFPVVWSVPCSRKICH